MADIEILIGNFILHLKSQRNFSRHTVRAYKSDLGEFLKYFREQGLSEPGKMDRFFLRGYLGRVQEKKISRNTLLRKISAVKSFVNYLVSGGKIENDPFSLISSPKKEKRLPQFLTEAEMDKLVDYNRPGEGSEENAKGFLTLRDFTILLFMYSTGLRRSEVSSLNVGDVDFLAGFVRVMGKGARERMVPVGDNAAKVLRRYLRSREAVPGGGAPLFVNARGGRLSEAGVALVVKRVAKKARFARNVKAHSIRHSFATHLLDRGCDLKSLQEMLGHRNLATTEIYTHVSMEKLRKVYDKSHPRSKKSD